MTKEAIEHVAAAENTVAAIREEAREKIRQIKTKRDEKINQLNEELREELETFKTQERQRLEEKLQNKIKSNKEDVQRLAEAYEKTYTQKQSELTDYIVKEVLKRYGN